MRRLRVNNLFSNYLPFFTYTLPVEKMPKKYDFEFSANQKNRLVIQSWNFSHWTEWRKNWGLVDKTLPIFLVFFLSVLNFVGIGIKYENNLFLLARKPYTQINSINMIILYSMYGTWTKCFKIGTENVFLVTIFARIELRFGLENPKNKMKQTWKKFKEDDICMF